MLYTGTFILCFQSKCQAKSISIRQTNDFIQCVNKISEITGKKCIGVFVSNRDLLLPSYKAISDENLRQKNEFSCIHHEKIEKIKNKLMNLLYELKIFIYDNDGSIIMRLD